MSVGGGSLKAQSFAVVLRNRLAEERSWPGRIKPDGYNAALKHVTDAIETPRFLAPIVGDGYGSAITVEEQQARWDAGLDPRTGKPREETTKNHPHAPA